MTRFSQIIASKYHPYSKLFIHLYEFRVSNMRILFSIILLISVYVGNSLTVNAQQAADSTRVAKQQNKPDAVEISAYDNKIVVKNAPIGSKLEIYSVVGIRVKEFEMKQPDGEYTVNIAKGYYIIRIGDTVRKVAIR